MYLWMASRSKPFSLSCPVELLSHVFNLLSEEKLLFGVAVLIGNVARTVNRREIFGKTVESHSWREDTAEEDLSMIRGFSHLVRQSSVSCFRQPCLGRILPYDSSKDSNFMFLGSIDTIFEGTRMLRWDNRFWWNSKGCFSSSIKWSRKK